MDRPSLSAVASLLKGALKEKTKQRWYLDPDVTKIKNYYQLVRAKLPNLSFSQRIKVQQWVERSRKRINAKRPHYKIH